MALAKAHVERVVYERFREGIARLEEGPEKDALETLAALYALWHIERDRGWFLESGYIEGRKARAIRALVNQLCGEVRPIAVDLVDAFAIPDEALAAPIAQ